MKKALLFSLSFIASISLLSSCANNTETNTADKNAVEEKVEVVEEEAKVELIITDIEELEAKLKEEERKVVVFIYKEGQENSELLRDNTLMNPDVATLLNENFYFVALDYAEKKDLHLIDDVFVYKTDENSNNGYNELAKTMLWDSQELPAVVFFNEKVERIQSAHGYYDAAIAAEFLGYIAIDDYKNERFSEYKNSQSHEEHDHEGHDHEGHDH